MDASFFAKTTASPEIAYRNDIGTAELTAVGADPEFDAAERAFRYLRVLQIPTPRYSLLDAIALQMDYR